MNWLQHVSSYINQPVGISLINGQGVTEVLCDANEEKVYPLEYLYATQFAQKQYPLQQIQNITPFPSCQPNHTQRSYYC